MLKVAWLNKNNKSKMNMPRKKQFSNKDLMMLVGSIRIIFKKGSLLMRHKTDTILLLVS